MQIHDRLSSSRTIIDADVESVQKGQFMAMCLLHLVSYSTNNQAILSIKMLIQPENLTMTIRIRKRQGSPVKNRIGLMDHGMMIRAYDH